MRMVSPLSTNFWPRRDLTPDLVADLLGDFDRIFEAYVRPSEATRAASFNPGCDIKEVKDHYVLSFDIPGVKKDDIKIEVRGDQLTVSGERHAEAHDETSLRRERVFGKFERTFTLPTSINGEKIEAIYEDGVLSVALPKAESVKGRTVQIQSGQSGGLFSKILGSKKDSPKELKDVRVS